MGGRGYGGVEGRRGGGGGEEERERARERERERVSLECLPPCGDSPDS